MLDSVNPANYERDQDGRATHICQLKELGREWRVSQAQWFKKRGEPWFRKEWYRDQRFMADYRYPSPIYGYSTPRLKYLIQLFRGDLLSEVPYHHYWQRKMPCGSPR